MFVSLLVEEGVNSQADDLDEEVKGGWGAIGTPLCTAGSQWGGLCEW